ncbi:MAG: TetR/AcrR family transcriptional regulator [Gammaproteobacteria bacterium]
MTGRTDTRERILDIAEQLLATRGYQGFSYHDIAAPLGVKNAAIHYHFPTKADLGVAIIKRYRNLLKDSTAEFMGYGGSARRQLEGYVQFFMQEALENQTMCPMGVLTSDYFSIPDSMREEGTLLEQEVFTWLMKVLEVGRDQGELCFEGDAKTRALIIMSTLQGARQLARMMGSEVLSTALQVLREELYSKAATAAA